MTIVLLVCLFACNNSASVDTTDRIDNTDNDDTGNIEVDTAHVTQKTLPSDSVPL
jgi:hypothetical protein